MLDLVLCEACHTEQVRDIQGVREAALATDHVLVKVETLWRHSAAIKRKKRVSVRHLNANAQAQTNFATAFCEDLQNSDTLAYDMSLQVMWGKTVQAMRQAERTSPDPRR